MIAASGRGPSGGSLRRRTELRKIAIVNTADVGGGVERRSTILLDGLRSLGVDTSLVVGARRSEHSNVVWMHASPHVDYRAHQPWLRNKLSRTRWRIDRGLGREDFEHPLTRHMLEMAGSPPDLVLCQNLHGGYFDLRMLPWLSHQAPVVLSLNDSWLFTGHCACPLGCGRWETGCGRCPDLEIPPAVRRDATAANWRRKREILAKSRVWAIAPSQWVHDRAARSLLGPALRGVRVVPHGIDLESFSPGSRAQARAALGIGADGLVLLYVANLGSANPTKDFTTVRRALRRLVEMPPPATSDGRSVPIELIVMGSELPPEHLGGNVLIRHLAHCDSHARLAEYYRACDLYVHSAPEESFSLTTAEALACGSAVIAAAGGGIRELVDHDRTGLLLDPGDDLALADALHALLEDAERRALMGAAAAAAARVRFDARRMVAETLDWCSEVAARWASEAG